MLAAQSAAQQAATITLIDAKTGFLGRLIAEPGRLLTIALDAILPAREQGHPGGDPRARRHGVTWRVLDALCDMPAGPPVMHHASFCMTAMLHRV